MLLAALMTMDLRAVQLCAQQLVESPVFTSRSARREYFGRCIHTLSTVVQQSRSRRPHAPSAATALFVRYLSARLLQDLSSCSLHHEADSRILRLLVDISSTDELLRQAQEVAERLQQHDASDEGPSRVALGLAAYLLLSDALGLQSCTLDVLHLLTLEQRVTPDKLEWLQSFCSTRQCKDVASEDALSLVSRAGTFACLAGSLPALLTLSLDARLQDAKLYEQTVLALIACGRDEGQRNDLRAIAVEWLVGAAIAELRQLPVFELSVDHDAEPKDLEAFIRRLYRSEPPTTDASDRIVTNARVVLTLLIELLGSGGVVDALRETLLVDQVWTPSYASSEDNSGDDDFQTLSDVRQLLLGDAIAASTRTGSDCSYRGVLRLRGSLGRRSFEPPRRGLIPQALRTLSSLVWCLWARHRLRRRGTGAKTRRRPPSPSLRCC
ncbi:hypothetical protein PINS_up007430 [Pythium insidiosum]|nr:hypothetical protein PINS_up007430 [Pythium insidiosum]